LPCAVVQFKKELPLAVSGLFHLFMGLR
jgi:hypothetical protein